MSQPLKICWDYDNTMGDTEKVAMGNLYDLTSQFLSNYGINFQEIREEFMAKRRGSTGLSVIEELSEFYNISVPEEEKSAFVNLEMQTASLALSKDLQPTRGIMQALEILHQRGVEMAVVSSTATPRLQVCLKKTGQDKYFTEETIFSAQTTLVPAVPKPKPDIYEYAMRKMTGVPSNFIAVEDSDKGIKSARSAGIGTVVGYVGCIEDSEQLEEAKTLFDEGANYVIDDNYDMVRIYEKLSLGRKEELDRVFGYRAWSARRLVNGRK